ncbi:hypothetical protein [Psychromonas sp. SR45-3]|uniref:hypothetical protein n=1 Tax=Psychromonas sp. SR45-3 TaxID=2760930 RepID=UPI0015FD74B8|nr:hypothetical protein [Psychromonas sp. SR45-3]MBB1273048.1 hypothetical protein [Psychromonas sp. SR45-3]
MEYLPKLLARQFKWLSNYSILTLWFMCMGAAVLLPVLAGFLVKIDDYWALVLLSTYLICLVGMLTAKYYYQTDLLTGRPVPYNRNKHRLFLVVVYLFLSMAILLISSPLIAALFLKPS